MVKRLAGPQTHFETWDPTRLHSCRTECSSVRRAYGSDCKASETFYTGHISLLKPVVYTLHHHESVKTELQGACLVSHRFLDQPTEITGIFVADSVARVLIFHDAERDEVSKVDRGHLDSRVESMAAGSTKL